METCDACGPAVTAVGSVMTPAGPLTFCAHHMRATMPVRQALNYPGQILSSALWWSRPVSLWDD